MKIRNQSQPKITRRMTAFLLFFSMLLPIFTVFPSYAVDEVAEPIGENTAAELAPIETEDQVLARLTANSQVLNYVDETAFRAAGHVSRLPEEEDLNSYVFENEDGTRTAYILAEPVKYIDNTGTAREKNLSLASSSIVANAALARAVDTSAYTVTATDTPLTFPTDLSQGVRFTYKNYTVTLRPEIIRENTLFLQANGKAMYHNAFGTTAHLMYTPTNTGFKEDILLVREGDINTFSFILNTDGLIPAEDAGGWYLWDGIDISRQIRLGQVISYDANGDFSIGEMTITHNGGTTYRVALAVDPAFLESAIYPVTVDPTFTVSDNENGANAIEDIVLFEGAPNSCYSSMQYNTVGASSLGTGRTAFRLRGFQNSSAYTSAFEFTDVRFYVHDYSSVEQTVNLYPLSNTDWQENTATWNNIGIYYDGHRCQATIPVNGWATFNITELVNRWKVNDHRINAGFILISQDNTVAKKIYSSENTANTARRPYVVATYIYEPVIEINETMYRGDVQTINLRVTSHTHSVAWSVSDSSVISITSTGTMTDLAIATVYANKLGSADITATLSLSDGATASITKTIYVVLENGVYSITNQYLDSNTDKDYYLSPNAMISTDITARTAKGMHPETLKQYWWIEHLQDGEYVFRNIENVSNVLSIQSAPNDTFSAVLATIEGEVPDNAKWYILGGHLISKIVPEKALILEYGPEKPGNECYYYDLEFSVPQNILFERWTFTKSNKAGIAFRKTSTGELTKAPMITTKIGSPITIEDLGYTAEVYGVDSALAPEIQWNSSDTSIATVDASTGLITMRVPGKVKITAFTYIDGTQYSDSVDITISGLPNGTYYMQSFATKLLIQQVDSSLRHDDLISINASRWTVTHISSGYYTIRIGNNYLSVVNNEVKIVTKTNETITGSQLFSIETSTNNTSDILINCTIKPKAGESQGLILYPDFGGNGIALVSELNISVLSQWSMVKDNANQDILNEDNNAHIINVDVLYDYQYDNEVENATTRIRNCLDNAKAYYLSHFGLYFKFSLVSKISSAADLAGCTNDECIHECIEPDGSINTEVSCHCSADNIEYSLTFYDNSNADAVMLFTGHDLCRINEDNKHYKIGGSKNYGTVCTVVRTTLEYECSTVIHELGHLYGTPDHYGGENGHYTTDDVNYEGNKYYIGNNMYNEYCIYGENNTSAEDNGDVMCAGCQYWFTVNRAKFDD